MKQLHYIGKDHGVGVVPAESDRKELFTEAHIEVSLADISRRLRYTVSL